MSAKQSETDILTCLEIWLKQKHFQGHIKKKKELLPTNFKYISEHHNDQLVNNCREFLLIIIIFTDIYLPIEPK